MPLHIDDVQSELLYDRGPVLYRPVYYLQNNKNFDANVC